ncbi:hypothetical protein PIB30_107114 [Stylosanthes scabra]|uniref:Uncharacterized protein n=1 Tax=Stylosanthes scabra TaxID=79078 RepID=A0ABU6S0M6_9FABA|nr:hypothetical protein [Stylosanthes scabra]
MAEALICTQSWLCPSKHEDGHQEFDQFDSSDQIVHGCLNNSATEQGATSQL